VVRSRFPERRQSQVSEADPASLLREVFDALNEHDLDRIAAVADERFEFVDVGGGETVHGREQWRAYCGRFVKAFPDLTQEVTNLVGVGKSAFAEAIAHGTHTGPLETPDGQVPPTGRRIEVRFCVVARALDGLLVDGREYYDSMTLLTQLGLVPESAETAG
jgi:ketosteroid isomerase-like protein